MTNNRGFTIVESLIALGLVVLLGVIFSSALLSLNKTTNENLTSSTSERQLASIAENIRVGVEHYQVNFESQGNESEVLKLENLPMAWDSSRVLPRSECENCPGTFGFTVRPLDDFRGLFLVTLRMTHKSWKEKGEQYRDFNFVVSGK